MSGIYRRRATAAYMQIEYRRRRRSWVGTLPPSSLIPISDSDAFVETDVVFTLAAAASDADTFAATDGSTLAAAVSGADTAVEADGVTLAAAVTGSDAAAETDGATLAGSPSSSDTGAVADALSTLAAAVTASDSATETEGSSLDTGATAKSDTDTFTLSEQTVLAAAVAAAETLAAAELAQLAAATAAADTGTLANAVAALAAALAASDLVAEAEAITLAAAVTGTDAATVASGQLLDDGSGPITGRFDQRAAANAGFDSDAAAGSFDHSTPGGVIT